MESSFLVEMRERRQIIEDIGRIIDEHDGEGGFVPSQDPDFWRDFNRIEIAGQNKGEAEVPWLISLTQIDSLGPMGRDMFLSHAALRALREMPVATLAEGKRLAANLSPTASLCRKIGVSLVLAESASVEVIPLLEAIDPGSSPKKGWASEAWTRLQRNIEREKQ